MGVQVIVTENGEELVVLSRRDYDALLASLGDEEAEDRMTVRIVADSQASIERGEQPPPIAGEIGFRIVEGTSPVRAIREHQGLSLGELAAKTGLAEILLRDIDDGRLAPVNPQRERIASALGVDPRWLDPLSD